MACSQRGVRRRGHWGSPMPHYLVETSGDAPVDLASPPGASAREARVRARQIAILVLGSIAFLLETSSALAVCNVHNPVGGQTVTCDTTLPNPDTTPVEAVAGSTNVTVNVL